MENLWDVEKSLDLAEDHVHRILQFPVCLDLLRDLFVTVPYRRMVSSAEQPAHLRQRIIRVFPDEIDGDLSRKSDIFCPFFAFAATFSFAATTPNCLYLKEI